MSSNTYTRLLWRGDGYSQLPQGQRIGVSCYKEHKFLQALLQLYQSRGIALEQGEPPDLEAEVKQLARSLRLPLGRCWKLSHDLRCARPGQRPLPAAQPSLPTAHPSLPAALRPLLATLPLSPLSTFSTTPTARAPWPASLSRP